MQDIAAKIFRVSTIKILPLVVLHQLIIITCMKIWASRCETRAHADSLVGPRNGKRPIDAGIGDLRLSPNQSLLPSPESHWWRNWYRRCRNPVVDGGRMTAGRRRLGAESDIGGEAEAGKGWFNALIGIRHQRGLVVVCGGDKAVAIGDEAILRRFGRRGTGFLEGLWFHRRYECVFLEAESFASFLVDDWRGVY